MTREIVFEELKVIVSSLGATQEQITRDANLLSESIFDSIVAIDYMIAIEEKFDVQMDMTILEKNKLGNLSSMCDYISNTIPKSI